MDDNDLLRRCQQGDDAALSELVHRYQERIFRLAFRVLGDAARAEDATADALAAVWSRAGGWRNEAAAQTWIHRVAYTVILDHVRARQRWWRFWGLSAAHSVAANDDPAAVVADHDEKAKLARRVEQVLQTLTPEERALVHLHYFEQQSLAEIAVTLGVSRDALKMRLSRTRTRLRAAFGECDDLLG